MVFRLRPHIKRLLADHADIFVLRNHLFHDVSGRLLQRQLRLRLIPLIGQALRQKVHILFQKKQALFILQAKFVLTLPRSIVT